MFKIVYLNEIKYEEGMDVFDWIKKVYDICDLLHERLEGNTVKLYCTKEKVKEIDNYDRSKVGYQFNCPSLDLFLLSRDIKILEAKDGFERLEIIKE
jgi:hypothetical protein